MLFALALLVFVVVTVVVFAAMSLLDQRKAQARVLRDRLSTVQKPSEQTAPDMALLRDEVLSRIPAFDTLLRRSERVSLLQKMLAQGNIDVRAGNFLMLCAVSALVLGRHRFHRRRQRAVRLGRRSARVFYPLRICLAYAHQALPEI